MSFGELTSSMSMESMESMESMDMNPATAAITLLASVVSNSTSVTTSSSSSHIHTPKLPAFYLRMSLPYSLTHSEFSSISCPLQRSFQTNAQVCWSWHYLEPVRSLCH
jgi:hypothetical protein